MILKALRRAKLRHRILFAALLLFVAGLFGAVGVTSAFFQAELDTKTATFAGGYLAVPTIVGALPNTSTSSGYDGVLTWTNGTDQTTTDNEIQRILGEDRGATNNCTGATYGTTVLNSTTSPTTTQAFTYTDANRATTPSNINGDWYCYEIVHGWPNTTAPVWTATATTNVQIGLAPTDVTITGGTGKVSTNDTVVINFNQPVATTLACTANNCSAVCQFHTTGTGNDVTLIGDTSCSTTSDSYTIGKITGITNGGANNSHKKSNAKISISGRTITVTITANSNTTASTGGTWVTSTSVLSLATTHQATACTSGVNCTLTPGGAGF